MSMWRDPLEGWFEEGEQQVRQTGVGLLPPVSLPGPAGAGSEPKFGWKDPLEGWLETPQVAQPQPTAAAQQASSDPLSNMFSGVAPAVQSIAKPAESQKATVGSFFSDALVSLASGALSIPKAITDLIDPELSDALGLTAAESWLTDKYSAATKQKLKRMDEALEGKNLLEGAFEAAKYTLANPDLLAQVLVAQIPQLYMGKAVRGLTYLLSRAGKYVDDVARLQKALSVANKAEDVARLTDKLADAQRKLDKVNKVAEYAITATFSGLQAAENTRSAYDRAKELLSQQSDEELMQNPEYSALLEKGATREQAIEAMALMAARQAMTRSFATSLAAQTLVPGGRGRTLEKALAGRRVRGMLSGGVGEAVSEAIEGAGGRIAENIALRNVVDESIPLVDTQAGVEAGVGGLAGLVMGGTAGLAGPRETPEQIREALVRQAQQNVQAAESSEIDRRIDQATSEFVDAIQRAATLNEYNEAAARYAQAIASIDPDLASIKFGTNTPSALDVIAALDVPESAKKQLRETTKARIEEATKRQAQAEFDERVRQELEQRFAQPDAQAASEEAKKAFEKMARDRIAEEIEEKYGVKVNKAGAPAQEESADPIAQEAMRQRQEQEATAQEQAESEAAQAEIYERAKAIAETAAQKYDTIRQLVSAQKNPALAERAKKEFRKSLEAAVSIALQERGGKVKGISKSDIVNRLYAEYTGETRQEPAVDSGLDAILEEQQRLAQEQQDAEQRSAQRQELVRKARDIVSRLVARDARKIESVKDATPEERARAYSDIVARALKVANEQLGTDITEDELRGFIIKGPTTKQKTAQEADYFDRLMDRAKSQEAQEAEQSRRAEMVQKVRDFVGKYTSQKIAKLAATPNMPDAEFQSAARQVIADALQKANQYYNADVSEDELVGFVLKDAKRKRASKKPLTSLDRLVEKYSEKSSRVAKPKQEREPVAQPEQPISAPPTTAQQPRALPAPRQDQVQQAQAAPAQPSPAQPSDIAKPSQPPEQPAQEAQTQEPQVVPQQSDVAQQPQPPAPAGDPNIIRRRIADEEVRAMAEEAGLQKKDKTVLKSLDAIADAWMAVENKRPARPQKAIELYKKLAEEFINTSDLRPSYSNLATYIKERLEKLGYVSSLPAKGNTTMVSLMDHLRSKGLVALEESGRSGLESREHVRTSLAGIVVKVGSRVEPGEVIGIGENVVSVKGKDGRVLTVPALSIDKDSAIVSPTFAMRSYEEQIRAIRKDAEQRVSYLYKAYETEDGGKRPGLKGAVRAALEELYLRAKIGKVRTRDANLLASAIYEALGAIEVRVESVAERRKQRDKLNMDAEALQAKIADLRDAIASADVRPKLSAADSEALRQLMKKHYTAGLAANEAARLSKILRQISAQTNAAREAKLAQEAVALLSSKPKTEAEKAARKKKLADALADISVRLIDKPVSELKKELAAAYQELERVRKEIAALPPVPKTAMERESLLMRLGVTIDDVRAVARKLAGGAYSLSDIVFSSEDASADEKARVAAARAELPDWMAQRIDAIVKEEKVAPGDWMALYEFARAVLDIASKAKPPQLVSLRKRRAELVAKTGFGDAVQRVVAIGEYMNIVCGDNVVAAVMAETPLSKEDISQVIVTLQKSGDAATEYFRDKDNIQAFRQARDKLVEMLQNPESSTEEERVEQVKELLRIFSLEGSEAEETLSKIKSKHAAEIREIEKLAAQIYEIEKRIQSEIGDAVFARGKVESAARRALNEYFRLSKTLQSSWNDEYRVFGLAALPDLIEDALRVPYEGSKSLRDAMVQKVEGGHYDDRIDQWKSDARAYVYAEKMRRRRESIRKAQFSGHDVRSSLQAASEEVVYAINSVAVQRRSYPDDIAQAISAGRRARQGRIAEKVLDLYDTLRPYIHNSRPIPSSVSKKAKAIIEELDQITDGGFTELTKPKSIREAGRRAGAMILRSVSLYQPAPGIVAEARAIWNDDEVLVPDEMVVDQQTRAKIRKYLASEEAKKAHKKRAEELRAAREARAVSRAIVYVTMEKLVDRGEVNYDAILNVARDVIRSPNDLKERMLAAFPEHEGYIEQINWEAASKGDVNELAARAAEMVVSTVRRATKIRGPYKAQNIRPESISATLETGEVVQSQVQGEDAVEVINSVMDAVSQEDDPLAALIKKEEMQIQERGKSEIRPLALWERTAQKGSPLTRARRAGTSAARANAQETFSNTVDRLAQALGPEARVNVDNAQGIASVQLGKLNIEVRIDDTSKYAEDGRRVHGLVQKHGDGSYIIVIDREMGDAPTAPHEIGHIMADALTDGQRAILKSVGIDLTDVSNLKAEEAFVSKWLERDDAREQLARRILEQSAAKRSVIFRALNKAISLVNAIFGTSYKPVGATTDAKELAEQLRTFSAIRQLAGQPMRAAKSPSPFSGAGLPDTYAQFSKTADERQKKEFFRWMEAHNQTKASEAYQEWRRSNAILANAGKHLEELARYNPKRDPKKVMPSRFVRVAQRLKAEGATLMTMLNAVSKTLYNDAKAAAADMENREAQVLEEADKALAKQQFADLVERYNPGRKVELVIPGVATKIETTAGKAYGLARAILNLKSAIHASGAGFNIDGYVIRFGDAGNTAMAGSKDAAFVRLRRWAKSYIESDPTLKKIDEAINDLTDGLLYERVKTTAQELGLEIPPKEEFYQKLMLYTGVRPRQSRHTQMEVLLRSAGILRPRNDPTFDTSLPLVVPDGIASFLTSINVVARVYGRAKFFDSLRKWIGMSWDQEEGSPKSWVSQELDMRLGANTARYLADAIRRAEGLKDDFIPSTLQDLRRNVSVVRLAGLGTIIKQYNALIAPFFFYDPSEVRKAWSKPMSAEELDAVLRQPNAVALRRRLSEGHFVDELVSARLSDKNDKMARLRKKSEGALTMMRKADKLTVKKYVQLGLHMARKEGLDGDAMYRRAAQIALDLVNENQPAGNPVWRTNLRNFGELGAWLAMFRGPTDAVANTIWRFAQDARRAVKDGANPVEAYRKVLLGIAAVLPLNGISNMMADESIRWFMREVMLRAFMDDDEYEKMKERHGRVSPVLNKDASGKPDWETGGLDRVKNLYRSMLSEFAYQLPLGQFIEPLLDMGMATLSESGATARREYELGRERLLGTSVPAYQTMRYVPESLMHASQAIRIWRRMSDGAAPTQKEVDALERQIALFLDKFVAMSSELTGIPASTINRSYLQSLPTTKLAGQVAEYMASLKENAK